MTGVPKFSAPPPLFLFSWVWRPRVPQGTPASLSARGSLAPDRWGRRLSRRKRRLGRAAGGSGRGRAGHGDEHFTYIILFDLHNNPSFFF